MMKSFIFGNNILLEKESHSAIAKKISDIPVRVVDGLNGSGDLLLEVPLLIKNNSSNNSLGRNLDFAKIVEDNH